VVITGGTHVPFSPCYHFLETTWRYYLQRIGLNVRLKMRRPGFYPRGGGVIEAHIEPASSPRPLHIAADTPEPVEVAATGFSAVAGLPASIAERQAHRAESRLKKERIRSDIAVQEWEAGPGTVLTLTVRPRDASGTQSSVLTPPPSLFFGLGQRGKPAERVADEAVDALLDHVHGGAHLVDPHSADQLVLPLALAEGASAFAVSCVTQHLLTNVHVIQRFLEREIRIEGGEGEPGRAVID
jgi:RNA 3'-terminal phosphate cyclase (ATP)